METTTEISKGGLMALGMGAMIAVILFVIAIAVLEIIILWKVFTKAGKPGWACIVPIYNAIVMLEIIGKPWWHMFLFCIPFYNLYLLIKYTNLLSKSFGQEVGFTVGLIFLPIIFLAILAFSGSIKYVGPGGAAPIPVPVS